MQLAQIWLNLSIQSKGLDLGILCISFRQQAAASRQPLLNTASRAVLRSLQHVCSHLCTTAPRLRRSGARHPSPCRLQVAELRRHGVTLTLSLERPREPIPDVPAVYFLTATEANIAAVVSCTACCM